MPEDYDSPEWIKRNEAEMRRLMALPADDPEWFDGEGEEYITHENRHFLVLNEQKGIKRYRTLLRQVENGFMIVWPKDVEPIVWCACGDSIPAADQGVTDEQGRPVCITCQVVSDSVSPTVQE